MRKYACNTLNKLCRMNTIQSIDKYLNESLVFRSIKARNTTLNAYQLLFLSFMKQHILIKFVNCESSFSSEAS